MGLALTNLLIFVSSASYNRIPGENRYGRRGRANWVDETTYNGR